VTFESTNYLGYFLRHQYWKLELHPNVPLSPIDNNDLFKGDASFIPQPGLADSAAKSFESVNNRGFFIRHRGFHLWVERNDNTTLFKSDATFRQQAGLAPSSGTTNMGERIAVYADCHAAKCVVFNDQRQLAEVRDKPCQYYAPTNPPQMHDGECTHLVGAALAFVGASPGNFSNPQHYVWGTMVSQDTIANAQRGDIIQFEEAAFTGPSGSWGPGPGGHHTAIVSARNGTKLTLVEQNIVWNQDTSNARSVQARTYDFAGLTAGHYFVWRARCRTGSDPLCQNPWNRPISP
jgi:hypothetical protein